MKNGRNAALNGGRGSGQTVRRITELYEAKIEDLKANFDYVLEGKDLEIKTLGERCNQLLKDKGNLTDELAEWKEEWQEQVQKAIDEGWERTKLTGRVKELEQQIEKMKCCQNCKYHSFWGDELKCDYGLKEALYEDRLVECKNMNKWELKEND